MKRSQLIGEKMKKAYFIILFLIAVTLVGPQLFNQTATAATCPDLKVVFARGSGAERNNNGDFSAFKTALETRLEKTELSYEIEDLDYPAIGVGPDNILVAIGAFIGAGDAYTFGASVNAGANAFAQTVNATCPNTKFVLGGYSQGALALMKALPALKQDKIIYLATFGDPKLYLPEGKGPLPAACRGQNLSDYRIYVPDCQAYEGLLGSFRPYEPENMTGKVGTWCNKADIFCSSYFSIKDHTSYESALLYEDAAKLIFSKIAAHFRLSPQISSHDTAILIDSTGSMSSPINKYKAEALRLAKETLENGGRVALYDYRDLNDRYYPVARCRFDTCTLEKFEAALNSITTHGGGDGFESTLSASLKVMKELNWRLGATKSLVILTDNGFLNPDRDGVSYAEVVKLSKTIDPVNFYIITNDSAINYYEDLAHDTDGRVVSIASEDFLTLTDQILTRFDSLPRVEEEDNPAEKPTLTITDITQTSTGTAVTFETTGEKVLVALDDAVLGTVSENQITISELSRETLLTLVPLSSDFRGDRVTVTLAPNFLEPVAAPALEENSTFGEKSPALEEETPSVFIPKAPNTGRH